MKWRQNGTAKLAAVQGQVKVQPKADRRADKYRLWQNPTEVRFDQFKAGVLVKGNPDEGGKIVR